MAQLIDRRPYRLTSRWTVPKDVDLIKPGVSTRAREGLWLGPGSLAALLLSRLGLELFGVDPGHSTSGRLFLGAVMVLAFFGHVCSFFEMLGSLRGLTESVRSRAAFFLSVYWALIAVAFLAAGLISS